MAVTAAVKAAAARQVAKVAEEMGLERTAAATAGRRIRSLARSDGAPRATKRRTSARPRDEHPETPGSEVRRNLGTYVPGDSDQPRTTGWAGASFGARRPRVRYELVVESESVPTPG